MVSSSILKPKPKGQEAAPYEEYLRKWEIMGVAGRGDDGGQVIGDGGGRGSRTKKRREAGFDFRT